MKITYGQLKKLIQEAKVSPELLKQTPTDEPLANKNINAAIKQLDQSFRTLLKLNLMLAHKDKYDVETREFEETTYREINDRVDMAAEQLINKLRRLVNAAWDSAQ